MARRVVVTGLGCVTALGCEISELWDNICAGKSGVGRITRFDASTFKVTFAGEIPQFDAAGPLGLLEKDVKRLDRFVQFAMVAADKAIRQAGIDFGDGDPYRNGVLVGSGIGGLNEIEQQHTSLFDRGPSRVSPFMIPKLMVNAASGNISVHWKLRGPNSAVATACASATNAIIVGTSGIAPVKKSTGSTTAVTSASCDETEIRIGTAGFDGMWRVWPVMTSNMSASDGSALCKRAATVPAVAQAEFIQQISGRWRWRRWGAGDFSRQWEIGHEARALRALRSLRGLRVSARLATRL